MHTYIYMVDCSKVYIDTSTFSTPDNKFSGAFASIDIKQGELIESGIVRRINDKSFNGLMKYLIQHGQFVRDVQCFIIRD